MKLKSKFTFSFIAFQFLCALSFSQNTLTIEGQILDSKTKKPLEYAAIGVQNQHLGTISNRYGCFSFFIPDSLINDSIQINFLGYESLIQSARELVNNRRNIIKLKPISTNIEAITVRPLTPEQVLQKVIANYEDNYPQAPFITKGFYLQELIENDVYIDFIEAYVDIYNPPFSDTSECQARIIQGHTRDDLGSIQFLKRWNEKRYAKDKKKADRKGDTIKTDTKAEINVAFGGPQTVLTDDNIRDLKDKFDIKELKKYKLSFEQNTFYGGRELFVIRAISKKTIDHAQIDAKLYIDKKSFAIAILKVDMKIVMPIIARPFLKLYRIKIDELEMSQDTEYKLVNDKWYPNKTIMVGNTDLTKKYRGKYIEHSLAQVRQAFVSTDIQDKNVKPFPIEEQLTSEPLIDQLGAYEADFWKNRNKIEYNVK